MNTKFELPPTTIFTLSNGVKCVHVHIPHTGLFYATALGNAGSAYEQNPSTYGTAHFLEHVIASGTKSFPNEEALNREFHQYGASSNASTWYHKKQYFMNTSIERAPQAVKYVSECITSPVFCDTDIFREKNVILEEIKRERSNASAEHGMRVTECTCAEPRMKIPNIGDLESVNAISKDDLISFWQHAYNPANFVMGIGGDITLGEAQELLENELGQHGAGKKLNPFTSKRMTAGMHTYVWPRTAQSKVTIDWHVPEGANRDAVSMISSIMGNMYRSRLMMALRENHQYVYQVGSYYSPLDVLPSFEISTSTDPKNVASLIHEVQRVVREFADYGPKQEEIDQIVNQSIFNIRSGAKDEEMVTDMAANEVLRNPTFTSLGDEFSRFVAVTREDIQKAAQDIFVSEPTIVITNPS